MITPNLSYNGFVSTTTAATATTAGNTYSGTTAAVMPGGIFLSYTDPSEEIKRATQKVDEHVDQLEVDIEFLNEERKKQEETIKMLTSKLLDAVNEITNLKEEINNLKGYTDYLDGRIENLKNKDKQEEQTEWLPF